MVLNTVSGNALAKAKTIVQWPIYWDCTNIFDLFQPFLTFVVTLQLGSI